MATASPPGWGGGDASSEFALDQVEDVVEDPLARSPLHCVTMVDGVEGWLVFLYPHLIGKKC